METHPAADGAPQTVPEIQVSNPTPDFTEVTSSAPVSKKKLKKHVSSTPRNERSFLYRSSSHVIGCIEWLCGMWGFLVASNPWKAILVSLVLAGISGCGLYYVAFEFRPYKLWVKEPSEFKEVHEWKMEKFPNTIRKHIAIWEMDNILTANAINQMWLLHQEVEKSRSPKNNIRYSDVCFKVPSLISHSLESHPNYPDYSSYDYSDDYGLNTPDWVKKDGKSKLSSSKISKREADYEFVDTDYVHYVNDKVSPKTAKDKKSKDIPSDDGPSWLLSFIDETPKDKDSSHYLSPSNASLVERQEHCEFVEELDLVCYEESLLEVWGYDDELIRSLTDEMVLEDINQFSSSRVTGFPRNITTYLGGVVKDEKGRIVSAKGALYTWYTKVDMDAIRKCEKSSCKIEIDLGSGEEVDAAGMEWEVHLTNVVSKFKNEGMPVNLQASYLFGSIHRSALFQDIVWVCAGWGLLMVYVVVTLGKPLSKDRRIIPVLVGILCVGLAVLASYGICTISGIPYGPLNSVLPILLIALGVDDMYVILNAWDSTNGEMELNDVNLRTRKTLHQAGLAVTVTSLTDVIAFVIGATTEVPALRYFCVYAATGIFAVYVLQMTLFVAAVALNQRRKKKSNGSCLPSTNPTPNKKDNSANAFLGRWMSQWVRFLLKPPVTAFVLLVTGFALGGALNFALGLQQRFESVWLLPKSSDIYQWFKTMDEVFPKDGREGFIFFENVNFPEEIPELQKLTKTLGRNPYISRIDAWYEELMKFIEIEDLFKNKPLTAELFQDALSYFLFNEAGAKYRNDIVFDNQRELKCTEPAPPFSTFKISFQYIRLVNANKGERQRAMNSVRSIVANANLTGYRAPWALSYGQWETENVISTELLRNVVVVLVIVFVMTMVLLASIRAALLVLTCVLATLVDVAALMNFWGLTINTVSCIALVLAIGICVDYAAHITHGFLVAQGSRKFRAAAALNHMGPPVLHGGTSTLLAFLLLAPADTFVFLSYFKILTGVAIFGLYHAMVLLPILLALLGPPPYPVSQMGSQTSEDSHSCTTESTSYPYTPNSISPSATPQSTTPNSPSSERTGTSLQYDNPSFASDKPNGEGKTSKSDNHLSPICHITDEPQEKSVTIGSQALQNMKLAESTNKVNMFVRGTTRDKEDLEEIRNFSLVENPAIRKENVLKLYIKNS